MNGRCSLCMAELTTGEIDICYSCREERDRASYRTYENGYADGFRAGQMSIQLLYDEPSKMIQTNAPHYLIVTQEKYDEIVRKAKKGGKQ
jgi:hypothetical protein